MEGRTIHSDYLTNSLSLSLPYPIGWVELTQKLTDTNILKVDFSNNEVHGGFGWTNPKYRRMGFRRCGAFKREQFALDKGKVIIRSSIRRANIASLAAGSKKSRTYAESRYLKILWWKSVKEKPLPYGFKPPNIP